MRRGKDQSWDIYSENNTTTWEKVPIAILMDIRDELKEANISLMALRCSNFLAIPFKLDRIAANTKPKIKRKKKKVTA